MSKIKQNVMMRVHTIALLRPLTSDAVAAFLLFLIALYQIGKEVWVAQVYANMPSVFDVAALSTFMVKAFLNTEFIVQVAVVLAVAAVIWLARAIALAVIPSSRVSA